MSNPQTFFQVAASLIPALVFGGLFSERLKPPLELRAASSSQQYLVGVIAALVGGLVIAAEFAAIQASLTTDPGRVKTWLVSGVLTAATAVTASVLVAPWLPRPYRTSVVVVVVVLVGGVGAVGLSSAVTSLQSQLTAQQQLRRQRAYFQHQLADLREANNLNATGYDKALAADLQVRAQYGLISHATARLLRVCLADHVYRRTLRRFNRLIQIRGIPPIPGRRLNCRRVGF